MNNKKLIRNLFLISLFVFLCCMTTVNATNTTDTHTIEQEITTDTPTTNIQTQETEITENTNTPKTKEIQTTTNTKTKDKTKTHAPTQKTKIINQTTKATLNKTTPTKTIKTTNTTLKQKEQIIDNKNYDEYFDEDGFVLNEDLANTTIILNGEFKEKNFHIEDVAFNITGKNATLKNSTITVNLPSIKISNLTITNTYKDSAIILGDKDSIIENCNITYNTTDEVKAIYVLGNNALIQNNNMIVGGPSDEIDWYSDPDLAKTLAIAIVSNNNTVRYNNITTYTTISKVEFGAIESITIQASAKTTAKNNIIEYNNIYTNGTDYAYGVNLGQNIDDNLIQYNNITTYGNAFADSIQAFSAVNNLTITNNNIISNSRNMSDGIAISKDNMVGTTHNNTITNNNITVTGNLSTLIDAGNFEYSHIENNTGYINGTNINGYVITGNNNNILKNTIYLNSQQITDTGIELVQSGNNNITNNTIITNTEYAIKLQNSKDNTVTNNMLISKMYEADNAVSNDSYNIIKDNIGYQQKKTTIIVDNITTDIDSKVNITCHVYDEDGKKIENGKVIFKINGKTIKDQNGNILFTKVINATATIKNYIIPSNWRNHKYTLSAVYGENKYYKESRSTNSTITLIIHKTKLEFTSANTFKSNQTITLSIKITDITNHTNMTIRPINTGKVVFKINGKTLKNETEETIYANVINNTATITYTLPYMSTKIYNLTAVFSDSLYERQEVNSKITIVNK